MQSTLRHCSCSTPSISIPQFCMCGRIAHIWRESFSLKNSMWLATVTRSKMGYTWPAECGVLAICCWNRVKICGVDWSWFVDPAVLPNMITCPSAKIAAEPHSWAATLREANVKKRENTIFYKIIIIITLNY